MVGRIVASLFARTFDLILNLKLVITAGLNRLIVSTSGLKVKIYIHLNVLKRSRKTNSEKQTLKTFKGCKLQKLKGIRSSEHQTLSQYNLGRSDLGYSEVHFKVDKEERRKYNVTIMTIGEVVLLPGM
ncbi:hypothetical protein A2U01_0001201 [Trifolium medium]|uniref:Uncharacterized protein n=1 Tax=Trifolium medium TaxID=97028 RepID=A0A392LZJ4_9FABA|nr:hypothetical protein [Trifolium medium]